MLTAATCPPGFSIACVPDCKCYKLAFGVHDETYIDTAASTCQSYTNPYDAAVSSQLIKITSQDKMDYVRYAMNSAMNWYHWNPFTGDKVDEVDYWIGLRKSGGTWKWMDDTPLDGGYTKWHNNDWENAVCNREAEVYNQ